MKKFYYATDSANGAHVLTLRECDNIVTRINRLNLSIVHPCKTYAEAVKIVEAWKKANAAPAFFPDFESPAAFFCEPD